MLRLKSMPMSIMADVAIKISMSRLKAANVNPRIAPPVPKNPAVIPDKAPPLIELKNVGFSCIFLKRINAVLSTIKNIERQISSNLWLKNLLRNAPRITNKTAGIPMVRISLLSTPFLNKTILDILLER